MTHEQLMAIAKPIHFTSEMRQAILESGKMQTRRVIKSQPKHKTGDYLYVAEDENIILRITEVQAARLQEMTFSEYKAEGFVDLFYCDCSDNDCLEKNCSKCKCRLGCFNCQDGCNYCFEIIIENFKETWNEIYKKNLKEYSWEANPFVWVYCFEKMEVEQ